MAGHRATCDLSGEGEVVHPGDAEHGVVPPERAAGWPHAGRQMPTPPPPRVLAPVTADSPPSPRHRPAAAPVRRRPNTCLPAFGRPAPPGPHAPGRAVGRRPAGVPAAGTPSTGLARPSFTTPPHGRTGARPLRLRAGRPASVADTPRLPYGRPGTSGVRGGLRPAVRVRPCAGRRAGRASRMGLGNRSSRSAGNRSGRSARTGRRAAGPGGEAAQRWHASDATCGNAHRRRRGALQDRPDVVGGGDVLRAPGGDVSAAHAPMSHRAVARRGTGL
ncbi:hypothetical protein SAMN05428944_0298 [Streptomyces sp. 1222.5]|nr:hypothetical protein BX260_7797 [Streptomyces sp. 5112.2]SEB56365.1 hypothetical protein SAMN05428944_0298 [Streptomyces sp. 1222.5]